MRAARRGRTATWTCAWSPRARNGSWTPPEDFGRPWGMSGAAGESAGTGRRVLSPGFHDRYSRPSQTRGPRKRKRTQRVSGEWHPAVWVSQHKSYFRDRRFHCWGCWRRDVECQLGPGLWILDSKLQTSGPDGVVLHPQHLAHLVYQLELGIGNHEFPTFGWPAPGGHYFFTITFFACRPCCMGASLTA